MPTISDNNKHPSAPLIILADDDPSIRLILHHILQRDGYRVLDASNGREVMRLHQEHAANLILLDAIMPEQDGFVTCRMLKEQQPDLPILMITGLDDDQSIEHAFRVGADDYISKPVNWSVLKHRIARALSLLTPRRILDEQILGNKLDTNYAGRMDLTDETINAIEVRVALPVAAVIGMSAADHLLNSFALGYQQQKDLQPDVNTLSLPVWPSYNASTGFIDTLKSLDKKFGIPLDQIELRIHECHFYQASIVGLLPMLATLPVQLCIDGFSFSLRSLDHVIAHSCKHIMIDMTETRKHLASNDLWLDAAAQIYKDKGVTLHACGVNRPDDLQLAIRIGCVSASGTDIISH